MCKGNGGCRKKATNGIGKEKKIIFKSLILPLQPLQCTGEAHNLKPRLIWKLFEHESEITRHMPMMIAKYTMQKILKANPRIQKVADKIKSEIYVSYKMKTYYGVNKAGM